MSVRNGQGNLVGSKSDSSVPGEVLEGGGMWLQLGGHSVKPLPDVLLVVGEGPSPGASFFVDGLEVLHEVGGLVLEVLEDSPEVPDGGTEEAVLVHVAGLFAFGVADLVELVELVPAMVVVGGGPCGQGVEGDLGALVVHVGKRRSEVGEG